jgi:hypothetical protein
MTDEEALAALSDEERTNVFANFRDCEWDKDMYWVRRLADERQQVEKCRAVTQDLSERLSLSETMRVRAENGLREVARALGYAEGATFEVMVLAIAHLKSDLALASEDNAKLVEWTRELREEVRTEMSLAKKYRYALVAIRANPENPAHLNIFLDAVLDTDG